MYKARAYIFVKGFQCGFETKGQKSEGACNRNKESASKQATAVLIKMLFALKGSFAEKKGIISTSLSDHRPLKQTKLVYFNRAGTRPLGLIYPIRTNC